MKLISFDLKADMGFFKKPDINEKIYLTYNMLHKPALLGILGAIAGLPGYKKNGKLPEYYQQLKHLQIGIEPLDSDKGNYTKKVHTYNNSIGFCNLDKDDFPCNLLISEQILIKPSFRCYVLLNTNNETEQLLYHRICNQEAEYLPYLGKNDFSVWWERNDVKEHTYEKFDFSKDFYISTIFRKEDAVIDHLASLITRQDRSEIGNRFFYFERLPIGFDENLLQYIYADFVYSTARFEKSMKFEQVGTFYKINAETIIQLY